MQIVRDLGGYSYGCSDLVRRAMSKKDERHAGRKRIFLFMARRIKKATWEMSRMCEKRHTRKRRLRKYSTIWSASPSITFTKSHAAAYVVVAYETGYLKLHYPVEFMAALDDQRHGRRQSDPQNI